MKIDFSEQPDPTNNFEVEVTEIDSSELFKLKKSYHSNNHTRVQPKSTPNNLNSKDETDIKTIKPASQQLHARERLVNLYRNMSNTTAMSN